MRNILASLVVTTVLALFPSNCFAQKPSISERLQQSTLAVYHAEQKCSWDKKTIFVWEIDVWECKFEENFVCTATVIDQNSDTNSYLALTAGHCFDWEETDNYYVATDTVGKPVMHHVQLVKFENDERYDYGIIAFQSIEDFTAFPIQHNVNYSTPAIGTEVLNVNFAYGVAKQVIEGKVTSDKVLGDAGGECPTCKGRYFASIGAGPGSSGSAIVDAKTGMIVGIVEAGFRGTTIPTIIMPINKTFVDFMEDDSAGVKPLPEGPKPKETVDTPTDESTFHKFLKFITGLLFPTL